MAAAFKQFEFGDYRFVVFFKRCFAQYGRCYIVFFATGYKQWPARGVGSVYFCAGTRKTGDCRLEKRTAWGRYGPQVV